MCIHAHTHRHRHTQNKTQATKFSGQKFGLNQQQQQQQQSQTICLQNRSMCYFVYERACVLLTILEVLISQLYKIVHFVCIENQSERSRKKERERERSFNQTSFSHTPSGDNMNFVR